MKFRNRVNYFIPNLESKAIHGVGKYYFKDDMVMLSYILECTSRSILELMRQYSMIMDEEEIRRLVAIQEKTARSLQVDSKYCYQYFGSKNGIYQGISIENTTADDIDLLIRITQNDYIKNPSYQRRIELGYDLDSECYMVQSLVELERKNNEIIRSSFRPEVLKKVRKYIRYD